MSSDKMPDKLQWQSHPRPTAPHEPRGRSLSKRVWLLYTLCSVFGLYQIGFTAFKALQSNWYLAKHAGIYEGAYDAFRADLTSGSLSTAELEELFLSVPDAQSALAASRAYATHPHLASSKEDYEDALVILKLYQHHFDIPAPDKLPVFPAGTPESRSATLSINKLTKPSAWIDVYYPIMNTPLDRSLQILNKDGGVVWDADLVEDGDPADPEAAKYRDSVPTFHGLSADGDVQAHLIYANYGRQEDFQELLAKGANLTGKIVLARYGDIGRGLIVKGAQELGAVGVIIYSDPRDDGAVTVENGYVAYPHGPARNPTAVQRGSVLSLSEYPGDPTTPGYPAYENATRADAVSLPKIPSLPISWANAERLLAEIADGRKLTGKPSESVIKLVNHVDTKVMPIWNAVAAIPGHIKNETVLIGGHRDAWVMGAADPTSGTASLHEVIRGFGVLLENGWKPLRNVVFMSWDAEEYALVGSTEWAEDFSEWISDNVVTYINIDGSVSGSQWSAGASPSLAHLIRRSAQDIPHPTESGKTLWDARNDKGPYTDGDIDADFVTTYEASQARKAPDTEIFTLGSGSDFTAFLQRLGIASMNQGFVSTPYDAVYHYHSIYDSERWQEIYGDPGFYRHVVVAQHLGLVALRLIDSIIIPLNTTQYALQLDDYLSDIEEIATSLSLAVDLSPLHKSIDRVQAASLKLDSEKVAAEKKLRELLDKIPKRNDGILRWIKWLIHLRRNPIREFIEAAKRVQKANAKLIGFERGFISEKGIPGREWYRHLGVAPGKWLGYGATTFPSVYDALVWDKNLTAANIEVERVSKLLNDLSNVITP